VLFSPFELAKATEVALIKEKARMADKKVFMHYECAAQRKNRS